jgi:hypothetical protein
MGKLVKIVIWLPFQSVFGISAENEEIIGVKALGY